MGDCGIGPGQRDEDGLKFGVCACELNGKGGEDGLEVAPILKISGTEERSAEPSVCECPFRNRLRYGGFSCPSRPVQPVDSGFVGALCPEFNFV